MNTTSKLWGATAELISTTAAPWRKGGAVFLPAAEPLFRRLLDAADVRVGGSRPQDIAVSDPHVFQRWLSDGTLGIGETYMEGAWSSRDLGATADRLVALPGAFKKQLFGSWATRAAWLANKAMNLQTRARAFQVGEAHYDIGNDVFELMLDRRMVYSCASWDGVDTLDAAQEQKLRLVCGKAKLERGMRLLEIGCGWGGLARYAVEEHGVSAVGITISRQQAEYARTLCEGLPVEIRVEDYRDTTGTFDRITSIGMLEHVGPKNFRAYMQKVASLLAPGGLFVAQFNGLHKGKNHSDPWFDKYIFPNGYLPTLAEITRAADGLLVIQDVENIGRHYARTLDAWRQNLDAHRARIVGARGEGFMRMMEFYLCMAAAFFRAQKYQNWQMVLSKGAFADGYRRSPQIQAART